MAFEDRIESLRTRHQTLDTELRNETLRPLPDPAIITKLKKEKLRLKDEIMRLSRA